MRDESLQMSLYRQSIALVLTTKQQPNNTQKHKITKPMTNKLDLVKKNKQKIHTKRN